MTVDWEFEPVFLELESEDAPKGLALVIGGDVNTHAAMRTTRVWVEEDRPTIGVSGTRTGGLRPTVQAIAFVKKDSLTDVEPREK